VFVITRKTIYLSFTTSTNWNIIAFGTEKPGSHKYMKEIITVKIGDRYTLTLEVDPPIDYDMIAQKVQKALDEGLTPIPGEKESDCEKCTLIYNSNLPFEKVIKHLNICFAGVMVNQTMLDLLRNGQSVPEELKNVQSLIADYLKCEPMETRRGF